MTNDYLDVRSPYIKTNIYSSIHDRKNGLNLKTENTIDKDSSDNFLQQKIHSVSKRIVGDEIRRFAEIASREISEEFNNLENRINNNTEKIKLELENNLKSEVELLGHNIGKELDSKIKDLNLLINETEEKIIELEKKSQRLYQQTQKDNSNSESIKESGSIKPIFEIKLENTIAKEKINEATNINKNRIDNDLIPRINIESFPSDTTLYEEDLKTHELQNKAQIITETNINIDKNIKLEKKVEIKKVLELPQPKQIEKNLNKIISRFDKKGFFFNKNTFLNVKDLLVTEILNNTLKKEIDKNDLNIIRGILEELKNDSNKSIQEGETVIQFLKSVCD